RLERSYREAVRLLQARLAHFNYTSGEEKGLAQTGLAYVQRLAGDTAGADISAEQARNTLDQLKDQPNDFSLAVHTAALSQIYCLMGQKDLAIKAAERAIMLVPSAKDVLAGPGFEENLAVIQTSFGENSRAISLLAPLLQTFYIGGLLY